MASIQEIEQAFDAMETQVGETEGGEASAVVLIRSIRELNVGQAAEIQSLRDQVAAGGAATAAQLDALLTRQNAINSRLDTSEQSLAAAVVENPEPTP